MTAKLMRAAIELIMITDYFFLLGGKKKKDNKKEEPPAPAPKLKIAMFFLNELKRTPLRLRLNETSFLTKKHTIFERFSAKCRGPSGAFAHAGC